MCVCVSVGVNVSAHVPECVSVVCVVSVVFGMSVMCVCSEGAQCV